MKPKILNRSAADHDGFRKAIRDNLFFSKPKEHLEFISSGCEVLNCVLGGGWPLGRVVNIIGDKSTGKSLCAIEAMANFFALFPKGKATYCETEAAWDDDYAQALGLDISRVGRDECETVEELFDRMLAFVGTMGEEGHGLYIVDSLDALSDKAEMERGIGDSTYGATKPKQMGQLFRRLVKPLANSNVCVIIISQTRDAIGVTFGSKHTRSGGKALDFYASIIIWLAHIAQMKRTVKKVDRVVGVTIKAKTSKNKVGLPFRECQFDILFGYGIDDITSNLDFLKDTGELQRVLGAKTDIATFRRAFATSTAEEQAAQRLHIATEVRTVWYQIESSFLPRKGKYVL